MSQNNEWFIIDDINEFIEASRVLVFNAFGKTEESEIDELSFLINNLKEDEKEELNNVLSQEECLNIAKDFIQIKKNKKTNKPKYTISTEKYLSMIESFNSRMISNLLNDLVNKGVIETGFDTDTNDFIFWIKDNQ